MANNGGGRGRGKGLNNIDEIMSKAKRLTQKLKSGRFSFGNKFFKSIKSLGKHQSVPSKR
jgi:hypothetical protein